MLKGVAAFLPVIDDRELPKKVLLLNTSKIQLMSLPLQLKSKYMTGDVRVTVGIFYKIPIDAIQMCMFGSGEN